MRKNIDRRLIFQKSVPGRRGYNFPMSEIIPEKADNRIGDQFLRRSDNYLPEVSEVDVIRHYTNLSRINYGVDIGFYPLGSCSMKYNPKINEDVSRLQGFTSIHPLQPEPTVQGILELLHDLKQRLCEITGMDDGTLQPFAGAHGEFTGMKLFQSYFSETDQPNRKVILVPDSAHGTNPASANISGFEIREVPSTAEGLVTVENIKPYLNERLAGIMLTNPNTLGLFEKDILEVAEAVHKAGGLLYYDGANLNAVMGKAKPGVMGFDVVHVNLHKTFSTPHGGGGPGAGPVLVNRKLAPYLPCPSIVKTDSGYVFSSPGCQDQDIGASSEFCCGRISGFHGNVLVMVRAYAYMLMMGKDGLEAVSEAAVLNANYLREKLKHLFPASHHGKCKHEFVLSAKNSKEQYGVNALHIAKRLLDYGVHAPTVYFPLIVPEAMMIEPAETESKEDLDRFCEIMHKIYAEIQENPELVKSAPHNTVVSQVDEVLAAKKPIVSWKPEE